MSRCRRGFVNKRRWGTIPRYQSDEGQHDVCLLEFQHDSAHVVNHKGGLLCYSDTGGVVGDQEQAKSTLKKQREKAAR